MAFYVYEYRDPTRGDIPVYVGKGKGDRAWAHLSPTSRIGMIRQAMSRCQANALSLRSSHTSQSEAEAFDSKSN